MTAEEVFTIVSNHLIKQNKKSFLSKEQISEIKERLGEKSIPDEEIGCAYRGANGCKCAIGVLIPDDEYLPEMEGEIPIALHRIVKNHELKELLNKHAYLLFDLQGIHDNLEVKDWKKALAKYAKENNFKFNS